MPCTLIKYGFYTPLTCCLFSTGLSPFSGNYTCTANNGCSVVDYIIASSELFPEVEDFYVGVLDISDHFPVICLLNILRDETSVMGQANNQNLGETLHAYESYVWEPQKKHEFCDSVGTLFRQFESSISDDNIAESHTRFIDMIYEAGKCLRKTTCSSKGTKRKSSHSQQPEWWDEECDKLKTDKYSKLHRFRLTKSRTDLQSYINSKNIFKNMCRAKRLSVQCKHRQELLENRKRPAAFWKSVKCDTRTKGDSYEKIPANDWFSYFKTLFSNSENTSITDSERLDHVASETRNNDILDDPITSEEIISSIKTLRSSCSPGPDGTCMEMFKSTIHITITYLHRLFNVIMTTGNFPPEWSSSLITPVHKRGLHTDPNNYRAISVCNCLSKIFLKILSKRLTFWSEMIEIIDESQAGFRTGYSTVDNIFNLSACIQKHITRRQGRFYVFFIDFYKAFDNCGHQELWNSLVRKGIDTDSKLLAVFKSMYAQLKSCVKLKSGLIDFFPCEIGTKQGCVSSTIIFSLFINDLISHMRATCRNGIFITEQVDDVHAFMFADDVASMADTVANLQDHIDRISEFCDSTGMKLNLSKSKVMVFRNGGPLKSYEKWFYKNDKIEVVTYYKYLGSFFTQKLSWTKSKEILSLQASKALQSIYRYQQRFGFFVHNDAFALFDAIVKPILIYASEIWGYQRCDQIERVHIAFCKRLCCLNRNVANFFPLAECGRYPLWVSYMTNCIKYWTKVITMPTARYPKQCYNMLKGLDDIGRTTWATHIKRVIYQYGFGYVWIANEVGNRAEFLRICTNRLKDCATQELFGNVASSPKALTYKLYKSALTPETYLSLSLSFVQKRVLSNFRCSSHSLMIEKGRQRNIERHLRFCEFCLGRNVHAVEDEVHFLLYCPLFEELRQRYFSDDWLRQIACEQLFANIMSSTGQNDIFALAKYLENAFKLHDSGPTIH